MRCLIVLCCIALAVAKPTEFHIFHNAPAALASPVSISSQYHAQDALGQYSYGYSAGTSSKAESKTYDGVTRGGYSFLDANGVVQSANYVADDASGFNVAASNVVHDTPEVVAAKAAHASAYNKAAIEAAAAPDVSEAVVLSAPAVKSYVSPVVASVPAFVSAPAVNTYLSDSVVVSTPEIRAYSAQVPSKAFSYSTVAASPAVKSYAAQVPSKAFSYSTVAASPVVSHVAAPAITSYAVHTPVEHKTFEHKVPTITSYSIQTPSVGVVAAPAVKHLAPVAYSAVGGTTSQQYHAQDTLGQYSYGYSGGPVAKAESKTADGVVRGGYSYVDGNGLVQSANYVADDAHGFRVAGTNIPVDTNAPAVVAAKLAQIYDY